MINTNKPSSYASIDIPSTEKTNNSIRNWVIAMGSLLVTFLTAYFLYSGLFVMNTGSVSRIRLSTEPIVIEFDSDDMANADLMPGTDAWIAFHDKLVEDAGYNVEELRSNPDISVTFVAYDAPADIEEDRVIGGGNRNPDRIQSRPTAGITCFTKYTAGASIGAQKCLPTRRISNPIRTGCSAYDGFEFVGSRVDGDIGCTSDSPTANVAARCCQPTPDTEYEGADWVVSIQTEVDEDALGCVSTESCGHNQAMIGCTGNVVKDDEVTEDTMYGGVQNDGNTCRAQSSNMLGGMTVGAMCASQPEDGHQLKCEAVYSMTATRQFPSYYSEVQCPIDTVMFDCTSYLRGRIEDCSDSENTDNLYGEYYYKDRPKSKVVCKAIGGSDKVRAQATCCELE